MDMVKLSASARDPKVKPQNLRRQGLVPCVVYGSSETLTLQCPRNPLHKAFVQAGESTLVELEVGGKKIPVLFKEIQFDPVTSSEVHVDFFAVNMKKEIEAHVPLRIEGESLAVKDLQAILVIAHDHVTVRCLPADLPHELPISIASLKEFHDVLTLKDLAIPKGVTVMDPPETVLVTVQEPRKEEEIAPPPAAVPAESEAAVAGAEGAAPTAEGAAPAAATTTEPAKEKEKK